MRNPPTFNIIEMRKARHAYSPQWIVNFNLKLQT